MYKLYIILNQYCYILLATYKLYVKPEVKSDQRELNLLSNMNLQ